MWKINNFYVFLSIELIVTIASGSIPKIYFISSQKNVFWCALLLLVYWQIHISSYGFGLEITNMESIDMVDIDKTIQ